MPTVKVVPGAHEVTRAAGPSSALANCFAQNPDYNSAHKRAREGVLRYLTYDWVRAAADFRFFLKLRFVFGYVIEADGTVVQEDAETSLFRS